MALKLDTSAFCSHFCFTNCWSSISAQYLRYHSPGLFTVLTNLTIARNQVRSKVKSCFLEQKRPDYGKIMALKWGPSAFCSHCGIVTFHSNHSPARTLSFLNLIYCIKYIKQLSFVCLQMSTCQNKQLYNMFKTQSSVIGVSINPYHFYFRFNLKKNVGQAQCVAVTQG